MPIQPYLFFDGRCEEAIGFYERALGAKVEMMMRYAESPDPVPEGMLPPGSERKIMHASLKIGDAVVMASDGGCSGKTSFSGFSLSYAVPDEAAAKRAFDSLADGGQVQMPLAETFWARRWGMLVDRYGKPWMVNCMKPMDGGH